MNSERLADAVADAMELPPAERAPFLRRVCDDDPTLLHEALSLAGHGDNRFLEQPAHRAVQGEELIDPRGGQLAPGDIVGDCQIVALLGEGGMGEVYLAEDTKLERPVAVKLLKRSFDEAALLRRFRHERKVLAGLNHPNIARLYGGGTTPEGRSYLVMEYVEGERLDRFCDARGLGISERLTLFRKVCAAVAYAHQNLVVHRDLKPANLRVTPEGEPKLLDFGIAKLLDPEGTAHAEPTVTMQGVMTPEYASPEQLRGEPITTSSDVYSLGVVLFELLCGQRPFAHLKGRRPDELARAICEEEPPRPSTVAARSASTIPPAGQTPVTTTTPAARPATLRHQLAGDLDNIVAKALCKEPARRYPSVLALAEDLRRHCEGLPVRARRDTFAYRTGKFVRRNKAGVAAGALIVLALISGLVATTWQAHVADQERDRARAALAKAETARKQTQQINDFLQKLLGSASSAKMGKDAKVSQVLDTASADVDQKLAGEPEVLAEVHHTLGSTYGNLGLIAPAASHLRTALALFQQHDGMDDPRTVAVEEDLYPVEAYQNHHWEVIRLTGHVIHWLRQHPEDNAARLAGALCGEGFSYTQTHRFAEAQQSLEEALALYAKTTGEDSPGYAHILAEMSALKREEGDLDADVEFRRRQRAILSKITPDQSTLVISELNECLSLVEAGRFAEMEALLEPTKSDCRRIVGENDNFLYTNVLFLDELLDFHQGDFEKVAGNGKAILDRFVAYLPPNELDVVTANYLLGVSLTRTGRAGEGEPYLRTALSNFDPAKRAFFLGYGNAEAALGDCLSAQKRYAEAEPLLLTGYGKSKQKYGPSSPEATRTTACLHDLYLAWNKPAEAARYPSEATAQPVPTP